MRTIVVSDLHGTAALLERSLADAAFTDEDTLIIAGDLLDGGSDDTVGLAESLGATVLAGNHEVSAALGVIIAPQDASTRRRASELRERFSSGEWPLAAAADGWLVTHAGLSVEFRHLIEQAAADPARLAARLNDDFRREVDEASKAMRRGGVALERFPLLGSAMGPLWFRPFDLTDIPAGIRQIVGHTAPELLGEKVSARLAERGWRLVEPGGHRGRRPAYRYAVVEGGQTRVVSHAG